MANTKSGCYADVMHALLCRLEVSKQRWRVFAPARSRCTALRYARSFDSQTRIAANRDRDAADGTFVSRRIVRKSAVTYSTWPGGVVRALQADGQFKVRAMTRNKGKHRELAGEVVEADLNRPETLAAVFKGGTWCISRHHFFVRRNRRAQAGSRRGEVSGDGFWQAR